MDDKPRYVIRVVKHGTEVKREVLFDGLKLSEIDKPALIAFLMQGISSLRDW